MYTTDRSGYQDKIGAHMFFAHGSSYTSYVKSGFYHLKPHSDIYLAMPFSRLVLADT